MAIPLKLERVAVVKQLDGTWSKLPINFPCGLVAWLHSKEGEQSVIQSHGKYYHIYVDR